MNVDLRGAFWTPSATILSSASQMYAHIVRKIFANGEQGFAYDPNDLTTLFQDAAGTVPVTGAGQPVGLMLDKSKGLVLGGESVINGSFDTDTAWVKNTGVTISSGIVNISTAATAYAVSQATPVPANKIYKVTYTINSYSSGGLRCTVGGAAGVTRNSAGTFTEYVVSFGSAAIQLASAAGFVGSVDNFSVKEVLGNHAYQTVSASRPILRQSSILGTELVVNGGFSAGLANWVQQGTAVASVSAGVLSITAQGSTSGVYQDITTVVGRTYALDFSSTGNLLVQLYANSGFAPSIPNSNTPRMTFVATSSVTRLYAYCNGSNAGTIDNISLKHVTGFSTDQNYLVFDGVDDFLRTNAIDFTMADKISLFAGVRKLSDVNTGIVAELSTRAGTSLGAFVLYAPFDGTQKGYGFRSVGTSEATTFSALPLSPTSNVLAAKSSIAQDTLTLHVDSLQHGVLTQDQGTGNYGNYPLYIGRRGGTVLPFNGHLYSLIGISRLTTDSETLALEKAIAKQTGVTLNV